ncbi:MAG: pyridine nucleotide-disulfide oxidoreductase [Deltaproteobacteria bacterium]|nr:MAG: pyridine nucleotide-disulfide oxidoreductase [Deltaproteobacteria bacterium]
MAKKILVIGAVAMGPKVACRVRRLDPEAEVTVIDRDSIISYGGCGIPYYVGGDVADIDGLRSTQSHKVRDQQFFDDVKGIKVMCEVEAVEILRREKQVRVRHLADAGREELLDYDKLVIATGASPFRPPFPGSDLPNVCMVANLHHAEYIKNLIAKGKVGKAVVIGAGAIGLEMAEALTDLWDVKTTVIEMADQVLPVALGKNMATLVQRQLEEHGVRVMTSARVNEVVQQDDGSMKVVTDTEAVPCDLVILSAGIRPNTGIAAEAGLAVGRSGGIMVDRRLRTSDPDIYAGGDCVEVRNLISGESMMMPLGSLANRQGRVIATNISGGSAHFDGAVGTFCIKIFDIGVSKSGLTYQQALRAGYDPVFSIISQADRAHFYPTSQVVYLNLIADRRTRKVLGIEAAGKMGDAVKARVDAVASLLGKGIAEVEDICQLEIGYAPPYASAMDVINNAGNALDNILDGRNETIDPVSFFKEFAEGKIKVLDIRDKSQAVDLVKKYGERWISIQQHELRARLGEIPADEPLLVLCDTGTRSYEAQLVLAAAGITKTRNIQGGFSLLNALDADFARI